MQQRQGHEHWWRAPRALSEDPQGGVGRKKLLAAAVALLVATAPVALFASSATAAAASAATIPPPPPPGASTSTWQQWASEQRAGIENTNWRTALRQRGCSIASVSIVATTSTGGTPIPAGITTDSVSLTGSCMSSAASTTSSNAAPQTSTTPATAAYCPYMTYYNYGAITDGVACVGTATVNGNPNYMAAAYTYMSGGSNTGHTELGDNPGGSGCSTGAYIADASESTLTYGQYNEVVWGPRDFSATWTSTWWWDSNPPSGPWYSYGTVCGNY